MYSVTIELEGYTIRGWAEFCGPYGEVEWSKVTEVDPANNDKGFRDKALAAVEDAAYKLHERKGRQGYYYDGSTMPWWLAKRKGQDQW